MPDSERNDQTIRPNIIVPGNQPPGIDPLTVHPLPEGYTRTSGGLVVPISISDQSLIMPDDAAVLASRAGDAQKARTIHVQPAGLVANPAVMTYKLEEFFTQPRAAFISEVLYHIGEQSEYPYSAEALLRRRRQRKMGSEVVDTTEPGAVESVGLAVVEVIKGIQENGIIEHKAIAAALNHFGKVLKEYRLQASSPPTFAPEMPDLTQSILSLFDSQQFLTGPGVREAAYNLLFQLTIPSSFQEPTVAIMDYFGELSHPLAFSITTKLAQTKPESAWVHIQQERIDSLLVKLEGDPQAIFDNFDTLSREVQGIVYIGPPFTNTTGKIGLEVEFKPKNPATDATVPLAPNGYTLHIDPELKNLELNRDKQTGLIFTPEYISSFSQISRFIADEGSFISSLHFHLDMKTHPQPPLIGGLLGNRYGQMVEINDHDTWEVRGILPPMTPSGLLEAGELATIISLYIQASSLTNRPNYSKLNLGQKDYQPEQLIFGHMLRHISSACGRLAGLLVMQRSLETQNKARREGRQTITPILGINPLAVGLGFTDPDRAASILAALPDAKEHYLQLMLTALVNLPTPQQGEDDWYKWLSKYSRFKNGNSAVRHLVTALASDMPNFSHVLQMLIKTTRPNLPNQNDIYNGALRGLSMELLTNQGFFRDIVLNSQNFAAQELALYFIYPEIPENQQFLIDILANGIPSLALIALRLLGRNLNRNNELLRNVLLQGKDILSKKTASLLATDMDLNREFLQSLVRQGVLPLVKIEAILEALSGKDDMNDFFKQIIQTHPIGKVRIIALKMIELDSNFLKELTKDNDPKMREAAYLQLSIMSDAQSRQFIYEALQGEQLQGDENTNVVIALIRNLCNDYSDQFKTIIFNLARYDSREAVREQAAITLTRKPTKNQAELRELLEKSPDAQVRLVAVEGLGVNARANSKFIFSLLPTESDSKVRTAMIDAFAQEEDIYRQTLRDIAADQNESLSVRESAIRILGMNIEDNNEFLQTLLSQEQDTYLRRIIIKKLAQLPDTNQSLLRSIAESEGDFRERVTAMQGLAKNLYENREFLIGIARTASDEELIANIILIVGKDL